MLSTSTFTTSDFDVTDYTPDITTGLPASMDVDHTLA
jgi:hypothetical protein